MNTLTKINEHLRKSYWMLGAGFMLVLAVAAARFKAHHHSAELVVEIQKLEDNGGLLITQRDIKRLIQNSFVEDIDGMRIKDIDTERMERVLEDDPFVKNAEVWIDANDVLHIRIEQRRPMLRIIDNNGLQYYFDAEGIKMPMSKYGTPRVLVATGYIPAYFKEFNEGNNVNLLRDVFELGKFIKKNPVLDALIAQVDVRKNGDLVLIPEVGKMKVVLGDTKDVKEKMENLLIFLKEALPHKGWRRYKTINLKFANQVVAVKR